MALPGVIFIFWRTPPPRPWSQSSTTISANGSASGIHDGDHAEEIFSRLIASAFKFLNRNGGSAVRHVRGWFYQIANHVTGQYLKEIHKYDSEALEEILRGNRSLPDVHIQNEELLLDVVRTTINGLKPRLREFIELDLIELRSPSEICQRMRITPTSYRTLKHRAFKALRNAILEKGISPL